MFQTNEHYRDADVNGITIINYDVLRLCYTCTSVGTQILLMTANIRRL